MRPYEAALRILLSGIPEGDRAAASADVVAWLRDIYADRAGVPRWLELLLKS